MKRIIVVLLLVLLFGLVGCGESNAPAVNSGDVQEEPSKSETQETAVEATKTPKNAEAIQDDYEKNATIFQEGGDLLHIKEFVINKRRTDETSFADTVYVTATLVSESGVIQFIQDCVMTYGLYNEGWILDEITVTETKDMPLCGTDYSVEEIEEALRMLGYPNISDVVLLGHQTDLEGGKDYYGVNAKDIHKYMTENFDLVLVVYFDPMFGWSLSNASAQKEDCEIQWHIDGDYSLDGDIVSFELINNSELLINGRANKLIDTNNMAIGKYILDDYYCRNIDRECIAEKNYSIVLDNADWNNICYATCYQAFNSYFIGKDHIYYRMFSCQYDDYNRQIHFTVDNELIPMSGN